MERNLLFKQETFHENDIVLGLFVIILKNKQGGVIMTNIYLLDVNEKPLMPCHDSAFIRHKLKNKEARVVRSHPFTVQLLYEVRNKYKQDITLGVDAGYKHIGFSASTESAELFSAEIEQDCGMVERNKERRMYRRIRRNRLRYRKPRFNNRRSTKKAGWIAPSLRRKRDTHLRFMMMLKSIMPITKITVEIGLFDPALMKATAQGRTLSGIDYQHGEAEGFENMKTYIRYRDNYTCQNPDCACHKMKRADKDKLRLFVHHIGYWKHDRTNRPSNLITLCELSHTSENHQPGGILYRWKPKIKGLKETAFMNIVRKEIVESLKIIYPDVEVRYTYGYKTNMTRNDWHIEKSHHDDAFCIAGNHSTRRARTLYFRQHRRNNRSLEIFYDAKYIDARDGKVKTGKTLFCGRTTRNRNFCIENLHRYRKQKVKRGRRSIRRQHYMYQPNDIILYDGKKYRVKGIQNKGAYIKIENNAETKVINTKKVASFQYQRGIYIN